MYNQNFHSGVNSYVRFEFERFEFEKFQEAQDATFVESIAESQILIKWSASSSVQDWAYVGFTLALVILWLQTLVCSEDIPDWGSRTSIEFHTWTCFVN